MREAADRRLHEDEAPVVLYDPVQPILGLPHGAPSRDISIRRNQRMRRSEIFATIRLLLMEYGYEGVTVRRIADRSGYALQTVYNLAGPRDTAIARAVSDYTRYVGRTAAPDPEDPFAIVRLIECWLQSIEEAPEFCRQVSLIQLSPQRGIYYAFRDREIRGMTDFLVRQQRCGVVRADADIGDLAEQLVLFAGALCLDWADRPFPFVRLKRRMCSGYANLISAALASAGARLRIVANAGSVPAGH